jgi:hypothetical protein
VVTDLIGIVELPKHILLHELDRELNGPRQPETC